MRIDWLSKMLHSSGNKRSSSHSQLQPRTDHIIKDFPINSQTGTREWLNCRDREIFSLINFGGIFYKSSCFAGSIRKCLQSCSHLTGSVSPETPEPISPVFGCVAMPTGWTGPCTHTQTNIHPSHTHTYKCTRILTPPTNKHSVTHIHIMHSKAGFIYRSVIYNLLRPLKIKFSLGLPAMVCFTPLGTQTTDLQACLSKWVTGSMAL